MEVDKSPDAFRTISEVADDLDLPQHVLRFWETRFPQIKPLKRGGGRRYYRPEDVDLLRAIRRLLHDEGYTIKGVQRILKEYGVRAVAQMALTQMEPEAAPTPAPAPAARVPSAEATADRELFDFVDGPALAPSRAPPVEPPAPPPAMRIEAAPARPTPDAWRTPREGPARPSAAHALRDLAADFAPPIVEAPRARLAPPAEQRVVATGAGLRAQEIERLKAVLYELAECQRLLAGAREN